jgi:hypothetical protein
MKRLERFMEQWFYKVGYSRAAAEMDRQGFPEVATNLRKLARDLG